MSRTFRSRTTATAAAAALVLALAACNDDPDPSPTARTSTSTSVQATPTADPSASATVAAASGPLMKVEGAQMNAPAGWEPMDAMVTFETSTRSPEGFGTASVGALSFNFAPPPLDDEARSAMKGVDGSVKRRPNVEIDGEEFYHLAGPESEFMYAEQFGTVAQGYQVTIRFNLRRAVSAAERQRLVSESLETFTFG